MSTEVATTDDSVDERIRNLIWKGLGTKSARQIAEETGLTPERVLAIKREILDSVDVLSVDEARQKLIVDLRNISEKVQDDYDNAPYEFKSGLMNSAISAMKTVLVELNRMGTKDQEKIDRLNQLRIKELVSLMYEVIDTGVPVLAAKYGIPEDEAFAVFNDAMARAAARREANPL